MNQIYYMYSTIDNRYLGEIVHNSLINPLFNTTVIQPPSLSPKYRYYFDEADKSWKLKEKIVQDKKKKSKKQSSEQQQVYERFKKRVDEGLMVSDYLINSDFKALNNMKKLYRDLIRYTSNTYILFMIKNKTFILVNQELLLSFINEVEIFLHKLFMEYFPLNRDK